MRPIRTLAIAAAVAVVAGLTLTGCGDSTKDATPKPVSQLGKNERKLSLLAPPGYVENGSSNKDADWVTPFERRTGCLISVTTTDSSEQMAKLFASGKYDGAAVSGELSRQFMLDQSAEPVNTKLVKNYAHVVSGLRNKAWNSLSGQAYGVPLGRSANVLQWRSDQVNPGPTSLSVLYDTKSSYSGKISISDSPLTLADAALYAKASQPKLGIKNPYALSSKQFAAVLKLAKQQRQIAGDRWGDYVKQVQDFEQGKTVLGMSPETVVALGQQRHTPVQSAVPSEGTTGSSDTWMLSSKATHRNCMYRWMDHTLDPTINAQISEYVGVAPANSQACDKTSDSQYCNTFHATDESYYQKVSFATTPTKKCVAGSGDNCVDLDRWRSEWKKLYAGKTDG